MSTNELSRRIAIITGSTVGIGLAIAQDLVSKGGRVVINGRRAGKLTEAVGTLNSGRPKGEPVAAGVAGDAAVQKTIDALFDGAKQHFGGEADLVVVNAGRGLAGSVVSSDTGEWEEMIRTNVLGAATLIRAAAERMLAAAGRAGTPDWKSTPRDIVVIGSVVGRHVSPFSSMYGGTKFAVHGMTEGVRRELAPKGIRVTLVEPGFVVSEFQGVAGYEDAWFKGVVDRIGPVLEPVDVARVVSFVCSQPSHVHVGSILVRPTRQDYP
jgi:NADP-dependent 3-hydroxy acid dehydrogenase YdfG